MDFLVTVIGNAAVDPKFRKKLLKTPRETIDTWGFRLTKGEVEMLDAIFTKRQNELGEKFEALEEVIYENLKEKMIPQMCDKPCRMSISRPTLLEEAEDEEEAA